MELANRARAGARDSRVAWKLLATAPRWNRFRRTACQTDRAIRRQGVRLAPASLPPSGSVSPNPANARPAHRSGSHSWRCASLPNAAMGPAPRPTAASSVIAIDESTRAISSMATHNVVKSEPEPPYSSGNGNPNTPRSPSARTTSTGNTCSRSHRSACGAISCSANSRTTARNASCSSERSRSIYGATGVL